jgi:hypothetical protein
MTQAGVAIHQCWVLSPSAIPPEQHYTEYPDKDGCAILHIHDVPFLV